jgi:hypothetical protein
MATKILRRSLSISQQETIWGRHARRSRSTEVPGWNDIKLRDRVNEVSIGRWLRDGKITGTGKDGITSIDVAPLESHLKMGKPRGRNTT